MGEIKTKRWDDPIEPSDGTRILITRYRPRGLPKAGETWSQWLTALAPSKELLATVNGKGSVTIPWAEYRSAYLREMKSQSEVIAQLASRVRAGETLTLLCSSRCVRESRCHRSLLKELIESALRR
jgi:uncharacterized protein YeaO (DUF488 family)